MLRIIIFYELLSAQCARNDHVEAATKAKAKENKGKRKAGETETETERNRWNPPKLWRVFHCVGFNNAQRERDRERYPKKDTNFGTVADLAPTPPPPPPSPSPRNPIMGRHTSLSKLP